MIKQETIQEILSTARIEDVVQDYVSLKRRGVNLIGLCPFHAEKTPSFTVSPSKNFYKCFGCGQGGNAVNFLMEHEKFSYPEALRFLAKKYNIEIQEEKRDEAYLEEEKKRESLYLINGFANEYFTGQLFETEEGISIGMSYFKHRGLLESTIKSFSLGYCPKNGQSFAEAAKAAGYSLELVQELGLITSKGNDFFRERVIFPFFNLSGKVIGFGGRILNDQVKTAKYLNSPESVLYNKRNTLYGLYQARSEIRKLNRVVLVEGYTDVLSLSQNGIKNVVASSGTSLTTDQVRLIKRFTDHVRVVFDGDQAGQNAALRSLELFLEYGVNVEVAVLPPDRDPDSMIRDVGTSAFQDFLDKNSKDFVILIATNIQEQYAHDPVNKSVHIKQLVHALSKIRDQIKRALYIKECSILLEIEERVLFREVNKNIRVEMKKNRRDHQFVQDAPDPVLTERVDHSNLQPRIADPVPYQERDIIRVLLEGGHLPHDESENHSVGEYIVSNVIQIIDLFESSLYRDIIIEYSDLLSKGIQPAQEHFLYHSREDIKSLCMELLLDPYHYANWSHRGVELQTQKPKEDNYRKDSLKAILRFKLFKINERITEIEKIIREGKETSMEALLKAKIRLQEERRILADQQGTIVL